MRFLHCPSWKSVVQSIPLILERLAFFTSRNYGTGVTVFSSRGMSSGNDNGGGTGSVRFLGQEESINIDQDLFTTYKFSVEQLMELAGLSVAVAVHRVYGESHKGSSVVAIAGPGNNGGDAMVAARHLKLFGFENVTLLNARQPTKDLFVALVHQAAESEVHVTCDPKPFLTEDQKPDLVIDGLFGFSFKPPVRPDFQPFMDILTKSSTVVSVDIPSGWDVENGPGTSSFMPSTLVSLTAPKKCAAFFKGQHHFLGGRFVPPKLAEKYGLNLPPYPGTDCIAKL